MLSSTRRGPTLKRPLSKALFNPFEARAFFTTPTPPAAPSDALCGVRNGPQAVEKVKAAIEAAKGRLVVKEAARAVSERDEKLLAEKLEKLQARPTVNPLPRSGSGSRSRCGCADVSFGALARQAANEEVDGDDEEDSGDETMGDIDVEAAPALSVPQEAPAEDK